MSDLKQDAQKVADEAQASAEHAVDRLKGNVQHNWIGYAVVAVIVAIVAGLLLHAR